jgi:hypothetical protein
MTGIFRNILKKEIRENITEEVKSSAFKVLARPKSPASKTEILKSQK